MTTSIKQKVIRWLTLYVHAQLIVNIASLPILVHWGIPLSLATLAGNLLFSPLFTIFLVLSSLIFFTELLHIPNAALTYALNKVATIIKFLLSTSQKSWLLPVPLAHPLLLVSIPLILFLTIHFTRTQTTIKKIGILSALFTTFLMILSVPKLLQTSGTTLVPHSDNKLQVTIEEDGSLTLTDNGYFGRMGNAHNFTTYELLPYLVKNFGTTHIEKLKLQRPGKRSLLVAEALAQVGTVSKVINVHTKLAPLTLSDF